MSAIDAAKCRSLIKEFNRAVTAIKPLAEERSDVNQAMEKARDVHDTIGVLDAEHEASVLSIKIERLKHETHLYRKQIRDFLFEGIEQEGGSLRFCLKDEVPAGFKGDGRTWRIKVGNRPLKEDELLMMGGGAVVGIIPKGVPSLSVPKIDGKIILHLFPFAAIISLLGFMEAIAIAKAMAAKTGQRLDPNQELIGQGLGNMCGSFGQSYPTSGSFSRSAVNLQAGAISGMSSVITTLMVVIVLLFFTPLLYHLPQAVLAAVIMMAVIGLVNASGFIHAWRAQWYDGAISIIAFTCTLAFAPHLEKGIEIGVGLSLLVFLYKSMRPTVASLSRHEDESLRDAMAFGLKECDHIAVVRFDGPLFFANASFLEDQITERMQRMKTLKHILVVFNGINDMDASGEEALSLIIDRCRAAGVDISLSGVNESVMAVFKRTHLLERIGRDHIYATTEKAICSVHEHTHSESEEKICPLTTVCQLS
jgi:anti-anti-sigma factor